MELPSQNDYVEAYFTLFELFQQDQGRPAERGRPYTYQDQVLIVFFTMMLIRRITTFKAQPRWLVRHPIEALRLGFENVPHRTTLSRRFKQLYEILQAFTAFVGWWAEKAQKRVDKQGVARGLASGGPGAAVPGILLGRAGDPCRPHRRWQ